jgi:dCMP deaminase
MNGRIRPSWEQYAMIMARAATARSEDPHVQVGACALRHDGSIAGVGYNGAPPGINIDWQDRDGRRQYVIHAENNCLRYCKPEECKLIAVTMLPCKDCLKLIAGYKIKTVVFSELYSSDAYGDISSIMNLAKCFGISMIQLFEQKST